VQGECDRVEKRGRTCGGLQLSVGSTQDKKKLQGILESLGCEHQCQGEGKIC